MDHESYRLLKEIIDEVRNDVKEIKQDLGHYKGFVSGILCVFTILWAGATFFWDKIKGV